MKLIKRYFMGLKKNTNLKLLFFVDFPETAIKLRRSIFLRILSMVLAEDILLLNASHTSDK